MFESDDFKIIVPAEIRKSDDGEWVVEGVASTASRDRQGETICQDGIDPTPIDEGRAYFNWDHHKGPENILGPIDTYKRENGNFVVKGRLFKNHGKAQAVREIMTSLGKSDRGRMGMSVEGKILERGSDGKTIKKCIINAVALTMNPVNQESYAELVKSLNGADLDIHTKATAEPANSDEPKFSMTEVMQFIQKALSVGSDYAVSKPAELNEGGALSQENLDKKPKNSTSSDKKKKLKYKTSESMAKSIDNLLNKLQGLYPNNTRAELWAAFKDRLETRFPDRCL